MTVQTTANRLEYTGNGATTAFSVTFVFLAAADLKVYVNGALRTITTHYTVTGGNGQTGTVTFLSAPANGAEVVILRDPALTQLVDLRNQGAFFAEVHEQAFDKLTMQVQRLNDKLGQALVIPDYEQFTADMPPAADRVGKYLTFDMSGNPVVSGSDLEAYAELATDSAAAAAASEAAAIAAAASAGAYATTVQELVTPLAPTFDVFSGDGSETEFTLSTAPSTEDVIDVYISGVYQQKSQYSVSGTTLTFSSAPANGSDNIEVKIAPLVAYSVLVDSTLDFGSIT